MQIRLVPVLIILLSLAGCQPATEDATANPALQTVRQIDLSLLPNDQWELSSGVLQLSFCRDRINDALLAEREELRRWRVVGEVTAMPSRRIEGLEILADFYKEYDVLLWQLSGTVSSQFYRVAVPADQNGGNVFNALARIGRDRRVCFSALEPN
ncbi:hypothetical protein [Pseudidiomarina sp.]|uniref:hypothetical protein n=1 Tax=Pseudidiomarina sp. TaxID=2081707 RepID=UPI00299EF22D|nr:hypothetical protein [Pseudidiomarina sp.]MDX1705823.1 hypothetical protein [Pseudidiomarina sp.]